MVSFQSQLNTGDETEGLGSKAADEYPFGLMVDND